VLKFVGVYEIKSSRNLSTLIILLLAPTNIALVHVICSRMASVSGFDHNL